MFDLNIDPSNPQGNPSAAQLTALGVQMARFTYHDHSQDNPLNAQALTRHREKVQELASVGIRSLLIFSYDTYPNRPGSTGLDSSWETYLSNFTRRAAAIVSALAPWRPAVQIWNEPDHDPIPNYAPTLSPEVYAAMLHRSSDAVRAVDPRIQIVGAGLSSGQPTWLGRVMGYLDNVYPADVVAIHPYGQRPEPEWPRPDWLHGYVGDLILGYRRVVNQPAPIWITEIGEKYEVDTYSDRREGQAEYLRRFYKAVANEFNGVVERVAWFCYSDGMVSPFGLVESNGAPKPAYQAFQALPELVRPEYNVAYLSHNLPQTMVAGQTNAGQITLRNTSRRIWWASGQNRVWLGYCWYTLDGQEVEDSLWEDIRTPLPVALYPDQEVTLQAELNAPDQPGQYQVRWDLLEEMVAWFGWQGVPTLNQTITVNPDDFILDPINPLQPIRLSASHNNVQDGAGGLKQALDGNPQTGWSSRSPQKSGMWFQIDLGGFRTIEHLWLNNSAAPETYPRGYRVQLSLDGQVWTTVFENPNSLGQLNIAFPPQRTRYIRVTLTKDHRSQWWSVHEIVISDSVRFRATASHNNVQSGADNLGQALDLRPETRWSSRQLQSPGMWFQLDLQHIRTVRGLVLEQGDSVNDYPRGYIIRLSQNGSEWVEVARNPENTGLVDISFTPTPARYIHIEQTGSAEQYWWSIHQVRVR